MTVACRPTNPSQSASQRALNGLVCVFKTVLSGSVHYTLYLWLCMFLWGLLLSFDGVNISFFCVLIFFLIWDHHLLTLFFKGETVAQYRLMIMLLLVRVLNNRHKFISIQLVALINPLFDQSVNLYESICLSDGPVFNKSILSRFQLRKNFH